MRLYAGAQCFCLSPVINVRREPHATARASRKEQARAREREREREKQIRLMIVLLGRHYVKGSALLIAEREIAREIKERRASF